MSKNIVCICGTFINPEIQFCETCGLGLPEIKLKQPKEDIGEMILKFWDKEFIKEIKKGHESFIKLSESF